MNHILDKYLPEFDEEDIRAKLAGATQENLIQALIDSYKEKRVIAKMVDEAWARLHRIEDIIAEPSALLSTPGIPTADDLRRMSEDEDN
jgi:hypothetical protein